MLKRKSRPVYAKKLLGINTQGKMDFINLQGNTISKFETKFKIDKVPSQISSQVQNHEISDCIKFQS